MMKPQTRPGFPSFLLHHLPFPTKYKRKAVFPPGLPSTKILSKMELSSCRLQTSWRDQNLPGIFFFLENELSIYENELFSRKFISQVSQWVKNSPAMQETQEMQIRSLSPEDPWRRKWQPTPVFLPGESHGQRTLVGNSV